MPGRAGPQAGDTSWPGPLADTASHPRTVTAVVAEAPPRQPWDRGRGESARAYAAFRRFRDLGPLRTLEPLLADENLTTLRRWARLHDWRDRAGAWDDETHRLEDANRLEAIRTMHDRHQRAGRMAMAKALEALHGTRPEDIPPYAAARLLDLGARLERDTLTVSVEALQGVAPLIEDPWEAVARELDGMPEP